MIQVILALLAGLGAPQDTVDPRALRDSLFLRYSTAAMERIPGLVAFEWMELNPTTLAALQAAEELGVGHRIAGLARLDSLRRAAEERRITSAELSPKRTRPERAPAFRRRKGGGDDLPPDWFGDPKTPFDRSTSSTQLSAGPDQNGATTTGQAETETWYENWEFGTRMSLEPTVTVEKSGVRLQRKSTMRMGASLSVCPDANGIVRGAFDFELGEVYDAAGMGEVAVGHDRFQMSGTILGRVSDAAELVNLDFSIRSKSTGGTEIGRQGQATRTDLPTRTGEAELQNVPWRSVTTVTDWSKSTSHHADWDGGRWSRPIALQEGAEDWFAGAIPENMKHPFFQMLLESVIGQAESMWQNGECLAITLTPPGPRRMAYDEAGRFEVTSLTHRQTSERLTQPVTVTGLGVRNLAPESGVPAFGVSFVTESREAAAASYAGGGGTVALQSVSRRGKVEESFQWEEEVGAYRVFYSSRVTSEKRGLILDVGYRIRLQRLAQPDAEGNELVGIGEYDLNAVERKLNCRNGFPEDVRNIRGDGKVRATASASATQPGRELFSVAFIPLTGPRMRFFTQSFQGLEKLMHAMSGTTPDSMPLLAPAAMHALELTGGSGSTGKEVVWGHSHCDGALKNTWSLKVLRLEP